MVVVHLATVVLHAIAHHQIVDMQQEVVGADLVEDSLGEDNGRGFILYDHAGLHHLII